MTSGTLKGGLLAAAATLALTAAPSFAQDISACLITKTDTNPFFVKMREGAQAKADELGIDAVELCRARSTATTSRQVAAIETCVANGVNGILITAVRHRCDHTGAEDGPRRRRPGDRARHPARAGRRGRRHLRDRQLPGGRADRPVGQGDAGRRGGRRQDRHARPRRSASRRSTCCATRASCRASASSSATRTSGATRRSAHRRPRRDRRQRGGRPQGDGEPAHHRARTSTSSTRSTNRPPPAPTRR